YFSTNQPPSALDADGIATLIADRGAAASEIRARLEHLAKEAQALQGQLNQHNQYIDEHNAIISSFRRLPDHTLVQIFLANRGHSKFSPIATSHVSRKWRKLALDTPLMWTTIAAYIWGTRSTPEENSDRGMLERVSAFIQRSGALGLSIEVTAEPVKSSLPAERLGAHEDLAAILESTASRWEKLHVNVPSDSPLMRLLRTPPATTAGLHSLSINFESLFRKPGPDTSETASLVDPTITVWEAKSLGYLSLFGTNVSLPVRWPKLTSLHLSSGGHGHLRQHHITSILAACTNLLECFLTFHDSAAEYESSPEGVATEATLPSLRALELGGSEVLTLPSLTRLTTRFTMATDAAPEAESALAEWIDRYGDQLLDVSFDYVSLTQSALAYCLAHLPNVVRLKLTGKARYATYNPWARSALIDDAILASLTPSLGDDGEPGGKDVCFCPKLRRLECHMGFLERSKKAFVHLILARYGGVHRIEEVKGKEGAVDAGPLAIRVCYHLPLAEEAAESVFHHLLFQRSEKLEQAGKL
ncbi:hypothetical protein FA13DRAFT_1735788, partial [Coprinellus micaceus]